MINMPGIKLELKICNFCVDFYMDNFANFIYDLIEGFSLSIYRMLKHMSLSIQLVTALLIKFEIWRGFEEHDHIFTCRV